MLFSESANEENMPYVSVRLRLLRAIMYVIILLAGFTSRICHCHVKTYVPKIIRCFLITDILSSNCLK